MPKEYLRLDEEISTSESAESPSTSPNVPRSKTIREDPTEYSISDAVAAIGFGKQQWELLFISGLCWIADAFELMLLTFLLPAVQKEWNVNKFQESSVASISFLGMLLGAPIWGFLSDRFGRRTAFFISIGATSTFGLLSAVSPNIWFLLFARLMVGFGVSGAHVPFSLLVEYLPIEARGRTLISLQAFWTLGTVGEAAMAWGVLPTLGWRWLLAFSALPSVVLIVFYRVIPESPRYLLQQGRRAEAEQALRVAALKNGREVPIGQLTLDQSLDIHQPKDLPFSQLLNPTFRMITLTLWWIWTSNTFAYYGIVLVTPQYFQSREGPSDNVEQEIFLTTFITAVAEFPGLLITAYLVDKIGRKKSQASLFAACGVFTLLFLYDKSFGFSTFTAVMSRMAISGVFAATWLYTPEAYPTRIRSTGLGVCVAFSRIAAMSSPYVAKMFGNIQVPIVLYSLACFSAVIASYLLPAETVKQDIK
eukprot:TRINITY_DN5945_c0_g1_i1.p1 TRINITY_DN5945_c0_g1~~TRINITY_DN5945_c0_g1_i1.p1  ORF type:complete len:478 (-),score=122.17 TRINITY_DN5945_c0_g1_i1:115-1548(-)